MGKKLSLFWKCQIGGWIAYSLVLFPYTFTFFGAPVATVLASFDRDVSGFLLTSGMREIYRRVDLKRAHPASIAGLILATSIGVVALETFLFMEVFRVYEAAEHKISARLLAFNLFYFRTVLFVCWSLLYFGIKQLLDSVKRELRLAREQAERREAELQMLRAQINPHFLFNALNTILFALEKQKQGVAKMVQSLTDYLNYSLMHKNDDFVLLGEECDALMDYLALEKARHGEALNITCQIDPETRTLRVPGVLLQPLVENAIKFSRETSDPPFNVRLNISRENSGLLIEVCNTGRWITPDPQRMSGGIGLENIRQRLNWLYPGQHTLETVPEAGWVAVKLRIP